jgi:hypothetical protein
MIPTRSWRLHGLALFLMGLACATTSAAAATCADRIVRARGEPSRFEVVAKAKARGNWRAQVRAMPALGSSYATWSIAEKADYTCTERDGRYACTAFARPCRR